MTFGYTKRALFLIAILVFSRFGTLDATAAPLASEVQEDKLAANCTQENLRIPSFDGTKIATILIEPKSGRFQGPRPTIIFANSWVFDEHEYIVQAWQFCNKGYIVLSYASRGFGGSEGMVSVAGPDEMKDVSIIIDWLEANVAVDMANVGIAGISYGAGMALLALGHDSRLKTAVGINGWANLDSALYGQDTMRNIWIKTLLRSGRLFGHLNPDIFVQLEHMRSRTDIEQTRRWAAIRSPLSKIAEINQRKAPVFIVNSYQDSLFPPAQMREFYDKLEGPKMFYMDKGVHVSSSFPGLIGIRTAVWEQTHRWLDHWLLGTDNGIETEPAVSFQTPEGREYYQDFPKLFEGDENFALQPLNGLKESEIAGDQNSWIQFNSTYDSGATTGIPIASDIGTALLNIPVLKWIKAINKNYAAVFMTEHMTRTMQLRGSPRVSFWLAPHETPVQTVGYLYDVNNLGVGVLIAHGVMTEHEARKSLGKITLDLNVNAYDIREGHRLAVAIDTGDGFYARPGGSYDVTISHGPSGVTTLSLPILQ